MSQIGEQKHHVLSSSTIAKSIISQSRDLRHLLEDRIKPIMRNKEIIILTKIPISKNLKDQV